jgi:beta-N-acetylhexosaminidase
MLGLSDKQMAGQRLMIGFDGIDLNEDLKYRIKNQCVGGLILFGRNIMAPEQVRNLCKSAQSFAQACGLPRLLIAIDQEGGTVARLKHPFSEFPGNNHMQTTADAVNFAQISAQELTDVGINMNMAPVLDVAFDPHASIMKERSFGSDPEWVAQMGLTVIAHLQAGGVMAVAKHFPGIGRTILDSHLELPYLETHADDLWDSDFKPFRQAIAHDVSGVMLAHICFRALDDEWPASLSKKIARNLLRHRMGYDGLIMTDDLDMGAIKNHWGIRLVMQQILEAEIDVPLICHPGPDIETACESIHAFQSASLKNRSLSERSVGRIMDLKKRYF